MGYELTSLHKISLCYDSVVCYRHSLQPLNATMLHLLAHLWKYLGHKVHAKTPGRSQSYENLLEASNKSFWTGLIFTLRYSMFEDLSPLVYPSSS